MAVHAPKRRPARGVTVKVSCLRLFTFVASLSSCTNEVENAQHNRSCAPRLLILPRVPTCKSKATSVSRPYHGRLVQLLLQPLVISLRWGQPARPRAPRHLN